MSDDMRIPGCGDDLAELPPETHALYRELLADGTAWRAGQPAMSRLDDTIAALMSQRDVARHTDTAVSTRATGSQGWLTDTNTKGTPPMQGKRLRGFAAAAATLAVVALFGVVLLNTALHRTPSHSPGASSSTDVHGQWVQQSRLSDAGADSDPAIAPTDPSVVYETANASVGIALRGTADGGATWHDISLPTGIHAADVNNASFFVSPLNAHTVFLWLADTAIPNCPAGSSATAFSGTSQHGGMLASGIDGQCLLVFVSTNSGSSWSPVHLPVPGVLGYGSGIGSSALDAQGSRLYGSVRCTTSDSCTRIVASDDGGRTWQAVDGAINASGQSICYYTASPTGAAIFAVTASDQCKQQGQSAMYLWRSDDAGAHWIPVGALPQPFVRGMTATANPSGGTPLLYIDMPTQIGTFRDKVGMIEPKLTDSPADLRVSADGGRTWHAAPAQGAPANESMYFGPYGVLSDGSVIFPFATGGLNDPSGESLYTWKLGDASWHKLAPAFPGEFIDTLTVVSSPGQGDTLWATGNNAVQPVGTPAPASANGKGRVPVVTAGGGYAVYVFRP